MTATHDATDALSIVIRAAAFAAHKHRDQRRKDANATPYINHPLELARILTAEGGVTDAATIAAALLHDTIEDTETSAAELDREFGAEIRSIVEEVTDDKALPKADRKRLQVERASHASHKAKLVKLADKICNLRDIASNPPAQWSLARKRQYFDWARQVVDGARGTNRVLARLFDAAYAQRP